jgi:hypothetical protein
MPPPLGVASRRRTREAVHTTTAVSALVALSYSTEAEPPVESAVSRSASEVSVPDDG